MRRSMLKPAVILALALLAAAGAPAAGVMASNAAFGAEKTDVSASPGAKAGLPVQRARSTDAGLRRRGGRTWRRPHWRRWPNRRITVPMSVACVVEKDFDEGGSAPYAIVRFVNTGQSTIPAGTTIRWQLSNGQWGNYRLHHALAPGQKSTAIDVPGNSWNGPLGCSAKTFHVRIFRPHHIR